MSLPNDAVTAIVLGRQYARLPVFQLLVASTPHVDELDADTLREHGAQVVLDRFTSIDNRYPFSDGPLVIRGLLCGYVPYGAARTVDGRFFFGRVASIRESVSRPQDIERFACE